MAAVEKRNVQVPMSVKKSENEMIIKLAEIHDISKTEAVVQAVAFALSHGMP